MTVMRGKGFYLAVLLALLLPPLCLMAQQTGERTIVGSVVDAATNEALQGVTVLAQGSGAGTTTDANGNFSLRLARTDNVLLFSYVGYAPQSVNVAGKQNITVAMSETANAKEERRYGRHLGGSHERGEQAVGFYLGTRLARASGRRRRNQLFGCAWFGNYR